MPKMQNSNDGKVVNGYLFCGNRPDKARIHHRICEEKCKKLNKCEYYNDWYNSVHGEDFIKPKKKKRNVRRKKK